MDKPLVAFDVDGALIDELDKPRPEVVQLLVAFIRFGAGVIVWSGGGADYARLVVSRIFKCSYRHQRNEDCSSNEMIKNITYMAKPDPKKAHVDISFDDQEVTYGTVNIRV